MLSSITLITRVLDTSSPAISLGYPIVILLLLALPSSSYARDAFVIVILVSLFIDRINFKHTISEFIKSPAIFSGTLLISYVTISAVWSTAPHTHTESEQLRNGTNILLFWFFTLLYFQQNDKSIKHIYWVIGAGLLLNLAGSWINGADLFPKGRLTGYGMLINPILLGSVAVIHIVLGLHLSAHSNFEKLANATSIFSSLAIISLTVSRGPLVACIISILIWISLTHSLNTKHKLSISIIIAIAGVALCYRYNLIEILMERGTSKRPAIWKETLAYSSKHIFLGWGWLNDFSKTVGQFNLRNETGMLIYHPHNLLISSIYYGGLIGFLTHIAFLMLIARNVFKSRSYQLALCLFTSIIMLTATDTYTVVTKRDFMLMIFWIPTAIIISLTQKTKDPASN